MEWVLIGIAILLFIHISYIRHKSFKSFMDDKDGSMKTMGDSLNKEARKHGWKG